MFNNRELANPRFYPVLVEGELKYLRKHLDDPRPSNTDWYICKDHSRIKFFVRGNFVDRYDGPAVYGITLAEDGIYHTTHYKEWIRKGKYFYSTNEIFKSVKNEPWGNSEVIEFCKPEEHLVLEDGIPGYNDFYQVDAPWIKVLTEYGTGYIPDMEAAKNIWKSKSKIVR